MARGVNKVILVGNLGADPEVKYMPNGNAVANVTIATSESWKDKQSGEQKDKTEWHRVVFFRRLAEIAGEYLKKGSQSTSRVSCRPASGRTKTVTTAIPLKLSPTKCRCWVAEVAEVPISVLHLPLQRRHPPLLGMNSTTIFRSDG